MTISEIKQAVDEGKTVCWKNPGYTVRKNTLGEYIIRSAMTGHCIGLDYDNGTKMNGEESDFFTK